MESKGKKEWVKDCGGSYWVMIRVQMTFITGG